ncbi:hypothetical protein MNBD_PLANCTO03-2086 [hydrothermal vent metagenome]|uniref:Endonuclease/exonuclease/phosphatase domain-containing protein n=1 Tax=hydrothermal vent metagenome TaxID=652676 RepID=A0A3B1E0Q9_9ZZZZ
MRLPHALLCIIGLLTLLSATVHSQWDPDNGQWGKSDPDHLRVMSWNVQDSICSSSSRKKEQLGDWHALVCIVASLRPDVLILQETGDNSGNGTGSGVDSIAELTTTIDLFLHGGNDPFEGGTVTSYVQKYAPDYDLPYVFVSSSHDGYNRNIILSRYPFADINGDGKSTISDIPFISPDEWAPGGNGGIRGFMFAELDLPDDIYEGDTVIANSHLKAGGGSDDHADRVRAAQNVGYYIYYLYAGGGTGTPDPNNKIADNPQATQILTATTPVIFGGDFNEDEQRNGSTVGPADWLVRGGGLGGSNGTDRDTTDSRYDTATEYFSGSRTTQSSSKLDYIAAWDSNAPFAREFLFLSSAVPTGKHPPELYNYPTPSNPNPALASNTASDHRPVIVDFILPTQIDSPPGEFALLTPADGQTDIDTTPTLYWEPASGASTYGLLLADNPGLSSPIIDLSGLAGTSFTVADGLLDASTTYYWGVIASNDIGDTDSTPYPASFTTRDLPPPGDFALLSPGNGTTDVDRESLFNWQNATDAETYTLTIATDAGLNNAVLEVTDLTESEYQVSGSTLSPCTSYYWGVTAFNAVGQTDSTPHPAQFETEGIADFSGNGTIDTIDFLLFLNLWNFGDPSADVNLDGTINTLDFLFYLNAFNAGC